MSGKKTSLWLVVILFLGFSAVLSACGDATPTTSVAPTTNSSSNVASQTTAAGINAGATTAVAVKNTNDTSLPAIPGAATITMPEAFKTQLNAYSSTVKNGQFTAFKVADASSKAEAGVVESYKKAGWEDKSATFAASMGQLSSMGVFVKVYQKGNQTAMVFGYPGSMAAAMATGSGISQTDTLVMVMSGQS